MLETIVGLLSATGLGVIGWAIHLGSRVAVLEANEQSLKELIETRFDDVERRLERIELSLNGHLKHR